MELTRLIAGLGTPEAYKHAVKDVIIHQTHISVVFLAGKFAYKIKKPVNFSFLDYSTLEKRKHFCDEELRLNRRLAANVYLDVVPITFDGQSFSVDGSGDVVEWAVMMERLQERDTLEFAVRHGEVQGEIFQELAALLVRFHCDAEGGTRVVEFARFDVVFANAQENFSQSEPHIGITLSRAVFERLQSLTLAILETQRSLIENRAARGIPRETHGDLRLEHIYRRPGRTSPEDMLIVDGIEFNERFRFADPLSDIAFLAMDLIAEGRRDLAEVFIDAYIAASGDEEGRPLLPFYVSYRAAVRGKIGGLKACELEVPEAERLRATEAARKHWLVALGALEEPDKTPCVLLVGGLPGTGKSTLARGLAERAGFTLIRSDVVRKELASARGIVDGTRIAYEEGIYTTEWTDRTYEACLERAKPILFGGGRVLIDASFREDSRRSLVLDFARSWGVRTAIIVCEAAPELVRDRLEARTGDASDADWSIYEHSASHWEEPGPRTVGFARAIDTGLGVEETLRLAKKELQHFGLSS